MQSMVMYTVAGQEQYVTGTNQGNKGLRNGNVTQMASLPNTP